MLKLLLIEPTNWDAATVACWMHEVLHSHLLLLYFAYSVLLFSC